jgi:AraC-like DNA-binding protein
VELRGAGRVFGVKFRPGGFVALCGERVARDEVRRLGDELGPNGDRLAGQVLAEDDDRARAAHVDAHLARLAPEPDDAYLDLLALVDEMAADRTITRVAEVAALAGTSVRGLQRRFDHFLGVTPKWVLRRYRIHDAVASIDEGETDLAGLAAALGWSDQAHFSREFKATVGVTPREYVARPGPHGG